MASGLWIGLCITKCRHCQGFPYHEQVVLILVRFSKSSGIQCHDHATCIINATLPTHTQAFIQAVLLMSVFEQRLSFRMFYFRKTIMKWLQNAYGCHLGVLSSATGSWRSPGGGSGSKNFLAFLHLEDKKIA